MTYRPGTEGRLDMERPLTTATSLPEVILRRDRAIVITGLVVVSGLAWAYMFHLAGQMGEMDMSGVANMAMPYTKPWSGVDLALLFVMWSVMMVAMMVPSAAPMILLFAKVQRQRPEYRSPLAPTAALTVGYVLVWTGFSVAATVAQWVLHNNGLLSTMMVSTNRLLGAGVLLAAGLFQWTPLKRACLRHCRSPLSFFMTAWKEGTLGALRMGLEHGAYCVACCWLLMALLFIAGVMNLLWVAAIMVFLLIEKLVPGGEVAGRIAGGLLIAAGLATALWPGC